MPGPIRIVGMVVVVWAVVTLSHPARGGQVFLLDFDTLTSGPATDHDYTPAERAEITSEMNALFAPLGMSVTDTPPVSGPFSTIFFNATAASTSDGVDFRNLNKDDDARVNAIKMLEIVGGVRQNSSFRLPAAGHRCGWPVH